MCPVNGFGGNIRPTLVFWFFSRLCNYGTIKLQCYIVDRRDKDDSKNNDDYDDDDDNDT